MLVSSACELVFEYGLGTSYTHAHFWQVHGHARFYKELDTTGCPKKNPKTIENGLLLEFQCLALN